MEIDLFDDNPISSVILTKKEKSRVEYLERIINCLRRLHGNGEDCIHPDDGHTVPDSEFDGYIKELETLKPNSNTLKGNMSVADFDPNAKKVKHDPPMTSIKKANGSKSDKETELNKFIQSYADEIGLDFDQAKKNLVVSYKHDGVACSIVYENGELKQAGLRPKDGVYGEDITQNIKYVKGVPKKLPLPITCIVRGELECPISVFQKINGSADVDNQEFANARNYTTGSIRQFKNPTKTKSRQLRFTAYSILGLSNAPFKTEKERAIWCNKTLKIPFVRTEFLTDKLLEELEDKIQDLDYEVDGAVISINNLEEQEQMGQHGSASNAVPKGKLAWKFADETADPIVSEITWNTGRTGQITPVCIFRDVRLAGTSVRKAASHSLGFIVRNEIQVGTKIRIRKSGKIIPQVLGRVEGKNFIPNIDGGDESLSEEFNFDNFDFPDNCPSCGKKTRIEEGQKHGLLDLRCDNDDCPAKNIKKFMHYLERFGVKGIGEATITRWVEAGIVTKFSDFYSLSVKQLINEGETPRIALLSIARIHMVNEPEQIKDNQKLANETVFAIGKKKVIGLAKFISCLGIPGAGRGTGTALISSFSNLDDILNATEEELENVPDIGSKTAKNVFNYLRKNRKDIEELTSEHIDIDLPKQGNYTGKTFVFTGGLPEGKDYWKEVVESEGGIVKSSVSKKTDFVIVGTDPGSKYEKAKDLESEGYDIKIIQNHDDLKKMFVGY